MEPNQNTESPGPRIINTQIYATIVTEEPLRYICIDHLTTEVVEITFNCQDYHHLKKNFNQNKPLFYVSTQYDNTNNDEIIINYESPCCSDFIKTNSQITTTRDTIHRILSDLSLYQSTVLQDELKDIHFQSHLENLLGKEDYRIMLPED